MEFLAGVAWCLSGWLAWKMSQKFDKNHKEDWQIELLCFIGGPFFLFFSIMEYLKQKKRKNESMKERLSRKKDIYDFWDWFWENE